MSEKYLIGHWVGFIQQIQHLVSRGYTEFHLVKYPEHKEDKFLKIDQKIITKYKANLNKDKAYYNKKKKFANFKFLRCGADAIILKTAGNLNEGVIVDDEFISVKKQKIQIKIGGRTTLMIGYDEKDVVTVFLSQESLRTIKVTCLEYLESGQFYQAVRAFNHMNALPSWSGIVQQKITMKTELVRVLNKHMAAEKAKALAFKMVINTKRTPVKVF